MNTKLKLTSLSAAVLAGFLISTAMPVAAQQANIDVPGRIVVLEKDLAEAKQMVAVLQKQVRELTDQVVNNKSKIRLHYRNLRLKDRDIERQLSRAQTDNGSGAQQLDELVLRLQDVDNAIEKLATNDKELIDQVIDIKTKVRENNRMIRVNGR